MRKGKKVRVILSIDAAIYEKIEKIGRDYGFSEQDLLRQGVRLVLDDYSRNVAAASIERAPEQLSA
jgi:hypothetical protein